MLGSADRGEFLRPLTLRADDDGAKAKATLKGGLLELKLPKLEVQKKQKRKYGWIVGFGYDDAQLKEQRHPTRDDLDQVSRDLPVVIVHQSGHLGVMNSKALELVAIKADTKDPQGGLIRRKSGSQEPDGVLEEAAFFGPFFTLLSKLGPDANKALFKAGVELYKSFGYTTAQE